MKVDVRHRLEVAPWLLARNDDAPAPGRLLVECGCDACGCGQRLALPAGSWSLEHRHGERWTAQLVELPPRTAPTLDPPRAAVDQLVDVDVLARGLAEAFTA